MPLSRCASFFLRLILLLALVGTLPAPRPVAAGPARSAARPDAHSEKPARGQATGPEQFDAVWRLTAERFFDPDMRGVDWQAVRDRFRPRVEAARSAREVAAIINEMLAELRSSHTRFFTDRDPEYYFLRAVFRESLRQPYLEWDDAGLVTVPLPEGAFVRDILDGGPAARAGLGVGDRIADATFDPVESFEGRSGQPVALSVQSQRGGPTRRVEVVPRRVGAQRAYLDATKASVRRLPLPSRQAEAGYVRLWALTHPLFLDALEDALAGLEGVRGLVLDLRGGYGGRSEDYLDLFLRGGSGKIETIGRGGERQPFSSGWEGPLVVLVDGGTRSAKELLAYSLRRAGRARLVGSRTAGAVLASRAYAVDGRSLLVVAVADLLADGVRLEGVGVEPDVVADAPLPYRNGADPQLDRALTEVEAMAAAVARGASGLP